MEILKYKLLQPHPSPTMTETHDFSCDTVPLAMPDPTYKGFLLWMKM